MASQPEQLPHVVTALLLATIEAKRKVPSLHNIRTILSPAQIKQNVNELGEFSLARETTASSGDSYDGRWEVGYLLGQREKLLDEMRKDEVVEKELAAMVAMFDSVKAGVDGLGGDSKKVKTMDWWGGVFETA